MPLPNANSGSPRSQRQGWLSRLGSITTSFRKSLINALLNGLLIVGPVYVTILLLLKAANSLMGLVRPIAKLFPDQIPAMELLSLLLVVAVLLLVGFSVRTATGQRALHGLEQHLLDRIPGYTTIRSLAARVAGESLDSAWKPVLAEIEEALVPAFIIEELEDGRVTVFIPSVPTPLVGAVYVLSPDRVHPVSIPFAQAINVVTHWGAGSKHLVAAMEKPGQSRDLERQALLQAD